MNTLLVQSKASAQYFEGIQIKIQIKARFAFHSAIKIQMWLHSHDMDESIKLGAIASEHVRLLDKHKHMFLKSSIMKNWTMGKPCVVRICFKTSLNHFWTRSRSIAVRCWSLRACRCLGYSANSSVFRSFHSCGDHAKHLEQCEHAQVAVKMPRIRTSPSDGV